MIQLLTRRQNFYARQSIQTVLRRFKSSSAEQEFKRLQHLRNVGILAHVDAGKTTVTERMLALAGVVRRAGCVDDGNTVTDFLPAERERGITIQSAAVSFEWGWHNHYTGDDFDPNDTVQIHLIDTPGHVDFSVEVNRSVAVLDGAVLVVDAVAGVQAQTETVWRAMTRPALNNHDPSTSDLMPEQDHAHEPLPCIAMINKMDKEGSDFMNAINSLRHKLSGANPIPMQMPLFLNPSGRVTGNSLLDPAVSVAPADDLFAGNFIGVVDLIHMRAIVYPDGPGRSVEDCIPKIVSLVDPHSHEPIHPDCHVTQEAIAARKNLIAALADVDEAMEESYLLDEDPTNAEIRIALRRATLAKKAVPVMAGAALKGRGMEPLLDSIADLLPSPLDRMAPALTQLDETMWASKKQKKKKTGNDDDSNNESTLQERKITFGHPLHPSLLALAFKVVHMKGRGGSGDGRIVFARVYSGKIKDGEVLQAITPPAPGESPDAPRKERVGGMLELTGGAFGNLEDGVCHSGDVCALVGLKSVVTGDTILTKSKSNNLVCLAGVASPKPVMTVRLEAETTNEQAKLSEALQLLAIEDPSLHVEETEAATLLSGLGELHIEVTLDRIEREFGLRVSSGKPAVAYRETLSSEAETDGLVVYDRTIGSARLQGAVHIILEPSSPDPDAKVVIPTDPVVIIEPRTRAYLNVDREKDEEELMQKDELVKALIQSCEGAMKRGPIRKYAMANLTCRVVNIEAEGGLQAFQAMPGALRAATANAVSVALQQAEDSWTLLEPTMSVEVIFPTDMVGSVLSDLHSRRATLGEVVSNEGGEGYSKGFIEGEVPLSEILGYANSLRSLTGGEGTFTAEYRGHSPCDPSLIQR